MALKTEKCDREMTGESSDEECLYDLKRKLDNDISDSNKRTRYEDSDDDIVPQVLLTVKIEPFDDEDSSNENSTNVSSPPLSPKKKGKRNSKKKNKNACKSNGSNPSRSGKKNRHTCEQCDKCFSSAFSLKRHKRAHQRPPEKCPYCDVTFNFKLELRRHIATHRAINDARSSFQIVKNKSGQDETDITTKPEETAAAPVEPKIDMDLENYGMNGGGIMRREQLSNLTQCAIISKMEKGKTVADICQLYTLSEDIVNEIWEEREKFDLPVKRNNKTVKYMNSVIDRHVLDWFQAQRETDVQISGKMLQDIADMYAKECGFVAFSGCKKWLDRFKKKYHIILRPTPEKPDYYSMALECKWKRQFFKETWCDVRVGYNNEDIYTADEVGVFYNSSKGRVKKCGGKKYIEGQVKDRLAIFICANVTGSDKKKLLVCGSEDPLLNSNRDLDTLPVSYIRHSKARFTTDIFEQFILYWNRELEATDRKVLLIIDRASIHTKMQLSNLKLVFVPWKASVGLIPIKTGIFRRMRNEFRKLLLEEKAMNAFRGMDRNVTCLEALNMLEKAWDRVTPQVIYRSFETIGYDIEECDFKPVKKFGVTDTDDEMLCDLLKDFDVESHFTGLVNLDMYLTVDDEYLKCRGTHVAFGGMHKLKDKNEGGILPIGPGDTKSNDEDIVRVRRAFEDMEIIKNFLLTHNTTYEIFTSVMDLESLLLNCSLINKLEDS